MMMMTRFLYCFGTSKVANIFLIQLSSLKVHNYKKKRFQFI